MQMIEIKNGDCLEEMSKIRSGSIDAIITDPPFGTVKGLKIDGWSKETTEWDDEINLSEMLFQCNRVLRLNGALILFGQEPYTSKLISNCHGNLPFSYRMIWLKNHFANPLSCKKAPVNYYEDILVFFKKHDTDLLHPLRHYSKKIMDHIGRKLKHINLDLGHRKAEHFFYWSSSQFSIPTKKTYEQIIGFYQLSDLDWIISYDDLLSENERFNRRFNLPDGEKFKSNVLQYKKDSGNYHPTQKPVALMEDLIKTYTNENDTVLDFTAGSFSTGVAAKKLNRKFIGIEKSKEFCDIGRHRLAGD